MVDYCTVTDVKSYLQITGTTYDTLLASLVTRASRIIDNACEHPLSFDQETITETVRAKVDNNGNLRVAVGKPKLISVSALSYRTNPTNAAALDVTMIEIDGKYTFRHINEVMGYLRNKFLQATVTYLGGYAPLPNDLVHSTAVLAARIFKQKDAGFADIVGVAELGTLEYTKVVPKEVAEVLANYKRVAPW